MSKDLDEVAARLEAFADNENVPDTVKGEFLNAALQMTELLSTAVRLTSVNKMLNAQLTAAQSRVAELEKYKTIADSFVSLDEKASGKLGQRVAELEREIKGWKNLLRAEGDSAVKQVAELTADNQRLRELLRECDEALQDWLDCLDRTTDERLKWFDAQVDRSIERDSTALKDRIKAAIGEGE